MITITWWCKYSKCVFVYVCTIILPKAGQSVEFREM